MSQLPECSAHTYLRCGAGKKGGGLGGRGWREVGTGKGRGQHRGFHIAINRAGVQEGGSPFQTFPQKKQNKKKPKHHVKLKEQ